MLRPPYKPARSSPSRSPSPSPSLYPQPDSPKMAPKYDPESGLPSSPSSRIIRRWITRRSRLILATMACAGMVIYLLDLGPHSPPPPHRRPHVGGVDGLEGIWEDEPPEEPQGWGWGLPWKQARPPRPEEGFEGPSFVVDQYGDHFYPSLPSQIAPAHPDLSLLPSPASLFSEIDIPSHLKPPQGLPFPEERMEQIYYAVPEEPSAAHRILPADSYAATWEGPVMWDQPRGEAKNVQWEGFQSGKRWETKAQKEVREERREAVRRGFVHAWQAYKDHAWGHDEIKPVSEVPSNPFNNWGASIVDSLDTLLLMGFNDEYNLCRPHVNQLNYHWVNGRDWAEGYVAPDHVSHDDSDDNEVHEKRPPLAIARDRQVALPVFETGIRYLGGLLGAYDLSGDDLLVERAVDLAKVLGKAFNTFSGLPSGRIDPGSDDVIHLGSVSVAEVGSMTLELVRLSQITKDRTWYDLAQRAMDYIEERVIPRSAYEPLIPLWFQPDAALTSPMVGPLTFGGLADSYYEYLIKTYKLLGAGEAAQQYRRIYEQSVDRARKTIYVDIDVVPGRDLLAIGKLENGRLIPEIEHLTCFAGAMLGLGARLLDRKTDLRDAERFTQSCYWLSAATPTGLQPEVVEFFDSGNTQLNGPGGMYENVTLESGMLHHPHLSKVDIEAELSENKIYRDRQEVLRWTADSVPVYPEDGGRTEEEPMEYYSMLRGSPPGSRHVVGRGINRPETIESIFYMFRLTGDRKWQEKGWKMFVSWMEAAKVPGGISSLQDVTVENFHHSDNMESFMFAETFKYHFLLQSEPDLLSLDDYVLNTEAHPLIANPSVTPGSQNLWTPIPNQHLGVRAAGTDVQKWHRLDVLQKLAKTHRPSPVQGGGKGMGGGGGRPGVRPKPPPFRAAVLRPEPAEPVENN